MPNPVSGVTATSTTTPEQVAVKPKINNPQSSKSSLSSANGSAHSKGSSGFLASVANFFISVFHFLTCGCFASKTSLKQTAQPDATTSAKTDAEQKSDVKKQENKSAQTAPIERKPKQEKAHSDEKGPSPKPPVKPIDTTTSTKPVKPTEKAENTPSVPVKMVVQLDKIRECYILDISKGQLDNGELEAYKKTFKNDPKALSAFNEGVDKVKKEPDQVAFAKNMAEINARLFGSFGDLAELSVLPTPKAPESKAVQKQQAPKFKEVDGVLLSADASDELINYYRGKKQILERPYRRIDFDNKGQEFDRENFENFSGGLKLDVEHVERCNPKKSSSYAPVSLERVVGVFDIEEAEQAFSAKDLQHPFSITYREAFDFYIEFINIKIAQQFDASVSGSVISLSGPPVDQVRRVVLPHRHPFIAGTYNMPRGNGTVKEEWKVKGLDDKMYVPLQTIILEGLKSKHLIFSYTRVGLDVIVQA